MRLLPALAALLIPVAASAQNAPAPASVATDAPGQPDATLAPVLPDIEFAADVQMRSISFGAAPQAGVRFTGGPALDTRHDVERDGLPRPVAGGRTYRDVTVRTTISATLLDPAAPAADRPALPTPDEDSE